MDTDAGKALAQALVRRQKEVDELRVVLDTAQAALRRAEATIKNPDDLNYVINQSAKWVMNFKL